MKRKRIRQLLIAPIALGTSLCTAAPVHALSDDGAPPWSLTSKVLPGKESVMAQSGQRPPDLQQIRENGKRQAAQAAFDLGVEATNRKNLGVAEKLFAEAALLQPGNAKFIKAASRVAFELKHYKAVEAYLSKLLGLYRSEAQPNQLEQLLLLDNLATLYRAQHKNEASKAALLEGVSLRQRLFGDNHPGLVESHYRLAALELASSNLSEAQHHLKIAIMILDSSNKTLQDRDAAAVYHNIGELYRVGANYDDAKSAYQKAMALWNKSPQDNRRAIAVTTRSLARLRAQKAQAKIAVINSIPEHQLQAPGSVSVRPPDPASL